MINPFIKKIIAIFMLSGIVIPHAFAASTTTTNFKVFLTVNQETAPVTPPPSQGGGGAGSGTNFPTVTNIVVTPSTHGAVITFDTSIPAQTNLSFGKNSSINGGTISDPTFSTHHIATINNLVSGITYYFQIEAIAATGAKGYSNLETFKTVAIAPTVNALSFTAIAEQTDIKLDWRMPTGKENSIIRIVRSENFYPTNIDDGITIFEGAGVNSLIDANVKPGIRYYYTLFVKGDNGVYSSGAVADAKILLAGEKPETQAQLFDRLSKAPFVDAKIASLTLNDFTFSQPGREDFSTSGNETLFIEGDKDLTIKLSYDRVPELLKTIAVTLTDPDDVNRKFTFLLRANDDKTFYEATIAPLGKSGEYKMDVAIVDYKNQGLKQLSGSLLAVVSRPFTNEGVFKNAERFTASDLMIALLVVLAMFTLSLVSARKIDLSYLAEVWSRYRSRRKR